MKERKIVQIIPDHDRENYMALAEDGTVWRLDGYYGDQLWILVKWPKLPPIEESEVKR